MTNATTKRRIATASNSVLWEDWYRAVCARIVSACGMRADKADHLPFKQWYETGSSIKDASATAIQYANR